MACEAFYEGPPEERPPKTTNIWRPALLRPTTPSHARMALDEPGCHRSNLAAACLASCHPRACPGPHCRRASPMSTVAPVKVWPRGSGLEAQHPVFDGLIRVRTIAATCGCQTSRGAT